MSLFSPYFNPTNFSWKNVSERDDFLKLKSGIFPVSRGRFYLPRFSFLIVGRLHDYLQKNWEIVHLQRYFPSASERCPFRLRAI